MGNFNNHGEDAATTGGYAQDALFARNIPANKRVEIRNVRAVYNDPGGVGGGAVFRLNVTDAVTGAPIANANFGTALLSGAAGPVVESAGDRKIGFNSGVNGCIITGTVATANANARGTLSMSGRYQ